MRKWIDITGQRFGSLVAKLRLRSGSPKSLWECLCDCGRSARIYYNNLTQGITVRCGRSCPLKPRKGRK